LSDLAGDSRLRQALWVLVAVLVLSLPIAEPVADLVDRLLWSQLVLVHESGHVLGNLLSGGQMTTGISLYQQGGWLGARTGAKGGWPLLDHGGGHLIEGLLVGYFLLALRLWPRINGLMWVGAAYLVGVAALWSDRSLFLAANADTRQWLSSLPWFEAVPEWLGRFSGVEAVALFWAAGGLISAMLARRRSPVGWCLLVLTTGLLVRNWWFLVTSSLASCRAGLWQDTDLWRVAYHEGGAPALWICRIAGASMIGAALPLLLAETVRSGTLPGTRHGPGDSVMLDIGSRQEHTFAEPLGLLSDCHRRIEMFLGRLILAADRFNGESLPENARQAIEASLRYFREAAPLHTADEEESLFPLLRACGDAGLTDLLAGLHDLEAEHQLMTDGHATVERLVQRWLDQDALAGAELSELKAVLQDLQQRYQAHIAFEDGQVFPQAAAVLSADQCEQVGRAMAARRNVPFG
jgi:hemerythrin-like domain-containing protein